MYSYVFTFKAISDRISDVNGCWFSRRRELVHFSHGFDKTLRN